MHRKQKYGDTEQSFIKTTIINRMTFWTPANHPYLYTTKQNAIQLDSHNSFAECRSKRCLGTS